MALLTVLPGENLDTKHTVPGRRTGLPTQVCKSRAHRGLEPLEAE